MLNVLLMGSKITAAANPSEEFPAKNLPPTSAGMLPVSLLKLRSKEDMLTASPDVPDSHCAGSVPAQSRLLTMSQSRTANRVWQSLILQSVHYTCTSYPGMIMHLILRARAQHSRTGQVVIADVEIICW